ncbi:MAG TPA: hypothetical protein VES67_06045 [Vicinamibacterales bacterium]|nr:hypothetical protein [Vicinamibacterales bacterium]
MLKLVPDAVDPAAVLALVADIDGDGSLMLDPEGVIARGVPRTLVEPLVESIRAADFTQVFKEPAGPEARIRCVHGLALLRAFLEHYKLSDESPYMGRSRDARLYSARIRHHLGVATDADHEEIAEAERQQ